MLFHTAKSIQVIPHGDLTIIAIESEPHMILQTGVNEVHIEYGDQSLSQYGGITSLEKLDSTLRMVLDKHSCIAKGTGETIFEFTFQSGQDKLLEAITLLKTRI